jgi:hypothetical protein
VNPKDLQVFPTREIPIKAYAAITLDASIHLVMNEWAHVLIPEGSLPETGLAVHVSGHHGHVLEVALASFVADRTIMGVVEHEPLDDRCPESLHLGIVDGDSGTVFGRGHAGHDNPPAGVVLVRECLDRALPA